MANIYRTHTDHPDFQYLTELLDKELWQRYPEIQAVYEAHAHVGTIDTAVIVYNKSKPVACGCFLKHRQKVIEIKRMFVIPEFRGQGIAKKVLKELENWAKDLGYVTSILETGSKQPEAIALYKREGYQITENWGVYKDLPESICFLKELE